jgi:hypothetical protein
MQILDNDDKLVNVNNIIACGYHLGGRVDFMFVKITKILKNGTIVGDLLKVDETDKDMTCSDYTSTLTPKIDVLFYNIRLNRSRKQDAPNGKYRFDKRDYFITIYDPKKKYQTQSYF